MPANRRLGARWERVAEAFLNRRGLKTVHRNFQVRFGEIDLIMLDGQTLVFTEVRFRSRNSYGSGADSVTPSKQKRIISAAQRFLQEKAHHETPPCRFDVVSIGTKGGKPVIDWIQDAFEAA